MITVSAAGVAVIIEPDAADYEARIAAAWATLTKGNVACGCCDSDRDYIGRVNEVGGILGRPAWDGGREARPVSVSA